MSSHDEVIFPERLLDAGFTKVELVPDLYKLIDGDLALYIWCDGLSWKVGAIPQTLWSRRTVGTVSELNDLLQVLGTSKRVV